MAQDNLTMINPQLRVGTFTSAGTPAAVNETDLKGKPRVLLLFVDVGATAPEIYIHYGGHAGEDLAIINHDTAQITSPTAAITFNVDGFSVAASIQNANGVNWWIALME